MDDDKTLRERLEEELLEDTPWAALRLHSEKDTVLLVTGVSLVDAAEAFASDDAARVSAWLESGQLRRLKASEKEQYEKEHPTFNAIIVQPWVLIQTIDSSPTLH